MAICICIIVGSIIIYAGLDTIAQSVKDKNSKKK